MSRHTFFGMSDIYSSLPLLLCNFYSCIYKSNLQYSHLLRRLWSSYPFCSTSNFSDIFSDIDYSTRQNHSGTFRCDRLSVYFKLPVSLSISSYSYYIHR